MTGSIIIKLRSKKRNTKETGRIKSRKMPKRKNGCRGMQRLVGKFRKEFNRPENTNFYSETDYKAAERKFIKLCLEGKFEFYGAKETKP